MNAMVTDNLDYCSSLLHGITAGQLGRIPKATNHSSQTHAKEKPTVMLNELHLLSIMKRVIYKLLLMVYKSQQDIMPDYITAHLFVMGIYHISAAKMWNVAPLPLKKSTVSRGNCNVFIQVELVVEYVLYGFMFHFRAFVFYINSVLNWVTC